MSVDDSYTKSLLHFNGADASTTFIDESGKTWTASGNAQIDTAQSVFGGASGLFDGNGDYISTPDHSDWQLDGGSNSNLWTIDFRTRFASNPTGIGVGFIGQYVDINNFWSIAKGAANSLRFIVMVSGTQIVSPTFTWNPTSTTQWFHIAVVKNGTTGYMAFIDGTQISSTQSDTDVIPNFNANLEIGRSPVSTTMYYLNGWVDELRISKGIARWTANFTPPTQEYISQISKQFQSIIWL